MNIPEAVAAHEAALEAVAKHFGIESVWYELVPHLDCRWVERDHEVGFWPADFKGEIDPDYPEYGDERLGRDARWETDEYTLFHIYNNGMKEAWLFTNALKVVTE
jgi:hypothetical protein